MAGDAADVAVGQPNKKRARPSTEENQRAEHCKVAKGELKRMSAGSSFADAPAVSVSKPSPGTEAQDESGREKARRWEQNRPKRVSVDKEELHQLRSKAKRFDLCLADMFNKDSKPHGDMEAFNKEEVEKLRSKAEQFDRCQAELTMLRDQVRVLQQKVSWLENVRDWVSSQGRSAVLASGFLPDWLCPLAWDGSVLGA